MKRPVQTSTGAYQRGMTLIELMIAMVIGLFLTAGLLHLFTGSKATYNAVAGISEIQEGGRISLERLKQKIRMTGYMGCSNLGNIEANVVASAGTPFTTETVITGVNNVTGVTGGVRAGSDTLTITTTSSADTVLSTDMGSATSDIITTLNPNNFVAGDLLAITDCENADLFAASEVNGSGPYTIRHAPGVVDGDGNTVAYNDPSGALSRAYLTNALLMRVQNVTFSVEDTTRNDTAGNSIFALYETPAGGARNEIITGVEDMQISYGVAADPGGPVIGAYKSAAAVTTAAEWPFVVSVRLALRISTSNNVGNAARPYYPLNDDTTLGTTLTTPNDNRIRRTFTTTIVLRNRAS